MKRIAVLTSGGDAPGMNAAIRSVVRYSINKNLQVFGIKRGYRGLIEGDLEEMAISSVGDIIHRGGTILRTARSEKFMTAEGLAKAMNILNVFKIDGLVAIGGDGTFRGLETLKEARCITVGVPATIDNDLAYTDYTIGFDTAVNTVLDAISKLRDTTSSHERISLVEVMGRNCGDIALYSGLAGGAEEIMLPEVPYDIDSICKKIIMSANRGKNQSIIVKAEGAGDPLEICNLITEKTGMDVRTTILGHIQRGGSPSAFDRILATELGSAAVQALADNQRGKVVGIRDNKIILADINEALNYETKFRKDLYGLNKILSI